MANKKTFFIEGKADFTDIITKFKQVRQELQSKGTSMSDLLGLDKQIEKIEQLQTVLRAAIQRGFSTTSEVSSFQKNLEKMNQLVSELGISFKDIDAKTLAEGFKNADKAIADAKAEYDALLKEQIKVVENSVKLSSNNKRFVESLKSAIKEGKDVKKVQEDITDELQEQINKQKQLKSEAEARKAQAEASKANLGQAEGLRKTGFKSVSTDKDGNTISKNISDEQFTYLKSNFKDIAQTSQNAGSAMSKFTRFLKANGMEMKNESTISKIFQTSIENVKEEGNRLQKQINAEENTIKDCDKEIKQLTKDQNALANSSDLVAEASEKVKQGAAVKEEKTSTANQQKQNLAEPSTVSIGVNQAAEDTKNLAKAEDEEAEQIKENITEHNKFNEALEGFKNQIKYLFSFSNALNTIITQIKKTYQETQELDSAFASIAMVTDYDISDMWSSYGTYADMAQELGQETKDVVEASALFYQQGLETNEVLSLTEDTMKLATLAGLDFSTATSEMTAA